MSWKAIYGLLLLYSTFISYFSALKIDENKSDSTNKRWLYVSVISNLGLLFVFKYFNFFTENVWTLLNVLHLSLPPVALKLILPIGISFFTFENMSYVFDVYYGKIKAEKHPGIYFLFTSFFPKLIAGPIERATNLLPQFRNFQKFNYELFISGLRQVIWGLFQKVVVADRLAAYIDPIHTDLHAQSGVALLIVTFLFPVQIYCDFSGYSHIAIGLSRMLGINLMENFNMPFYSRSVTEYWRRWHISLMTWLRDYVYTPFC
jgi:D-alanyl-lipoteichoic acid acyltransferase DltB (MBOAT superfamily)